MSKLTIIFKSGHSTTVTVADTWSYKDDGHGNRAFAYPNVSGKNRKLSR
jgi:hypothetical protein